MPSNRSAVDLRNELSKIAKISNIQAGLPILIRSLPVVAIMAGGVLSKATGSPNLVEERMLGIDETFLLNTPSRSPSVRITEQTRDYVREGVMMMCVRCWKNREVPSLTARLGASGRSEFGRDMYYELSNFGRVNQRKILTPWR
jgi:hypothetical protein